MTIKSFAAIAGVLTLVACGDASQDPAMLKGNNYATNVGDTTITISFAPDVMRVNGQVVNLYNGQYTADGNKITFGPIASTMMMGPADAMETERDYFQFLETVDCYDLDGGKLTLKNPDGKEIVFTQVAEIDTVVETETVTVSE